MVEWKKLGEVCEFIRGKSLSKKDKGDGQFPIILYGELYTTYREYINNIVSYTSESIAKTATRIEKGDVLLPLSSTTKEAQIGKASVLNVDLNVRLGGDAIALRHKENSAYLMYYINSFHFEYEKMKCVKGTTIMHLSPKGIADIIIPIPSLSEQHRIVETLDTFTASIDNLKEQIAQRRKQYEHYRDQLLDLDGKEKDVVPFGDVCEMIKGNGVQKVDFVENGIGCIHYGQIYTYYGSYTYTTNKFVSKETFEKAKKASKGDIVMTDTSENVEDICKSVAYLGEEDIAVSNHALIIKHKQNPRFLSYCTQTNSFLIQKRKFVVGAKVSGIKPAHLAQIKIYLPNIEEQSRIVSILDSFEASIANLEEQLALRQNQYEYYREKLLTFE